MESQDLGDDLLDEAVDVVFRRHGFIKEPKVGSVPDMVKDDDKEVYFFVALHTKVPLWSLLLSTIAACSCVIIFSIKFLKQPVDHNRFI